MTACREVDVREPGWRRRGAGRGFTYLACDGERVRDPEVIERIRALAIPPAWTDVWICPDPHGHVQATGFDDRGRRQYLYHPDWRAERDRAKHDRMLELARALPRLRRRLRRDLAGDGTGRDRVLDGVPDGLVAEVEAAVVDLIERGMDSRRAARCTGRV
jgi:DNA topoisomerase I